LAVSWRGKACGGDGALPLTLIPGVADTAQFGRHDRGKVYSMKQITITVEMKVPEEWVSLLQLFSEQQGISVTRYIRNLVEEHLDPQPFFNEAGLKDVLTAASKNKKRKK
jgi:hypothetical protein